MAKKCAYESEISNGAKAGITMFVVGLAASLIKRLGGRPKKRAKKGGST